MRPLTRLVRRSHLALLAGVTLLGLAGAQQTATPDAHAANTPVTQSFSSGSINAMFPVSPTPVAFNTINVPVDMKISNLVVRMRVSHFSSLSDLGLVLTAPNGTGYGLFAPGDADVGSIRIGDSNGDCTGTLASFTLSATQTLAAASDDVFGSYPGSYLPVDSFAAAINTSSLGTWTLSGSDINVTPGTGRLLCWELVITTTSPIVTSVSPNPAAFNSTVLITGENLDTVTGVRFTCGTPTTCPTGITAGFTKIGTNTLRVTVPAGAITGPITLLFVGGSVTTAPFTPTGFRPLPTIASVVPNLTFTGGPGSIITINGNNFGGTTAVTVCGTAVTSFTILSNAKIQAELNPATPTGACAISITNPTGTYTKNNAITVM